MKLTLEYRSCDLTGVTVDNQKRTIIGRAIVYNSMSNELRTASGDTFKEVIMPGALSDSLAKNDILAFKEHNPAMMLGRSSAGTLILQDRADGLYCEISVPDTSYGNDTLVSAARGDLKGFSFGFNSPKAKNYARSGQKIREIYSLNLREISIVSSPAYNETSLALRNEDFIEEKAEVAITETKVETVEEKKEAPVVVEQPSIDLEREKYYALKHRFNTLDEATPRIN